MNDEMDSVVLTKIIEKKCKKGKVERKDTKTRRARRQCENQKE